MIVPKEILIQLVTRDGKENALRNVLFGLKLHIMENAWYNYPIFKSDIFGRAILSQSQIINNTELKWDFDTTLTSGPTTFTIYVLTGRETNQLITATRNIIELSENSASLKNDLRSHGIAAQNLNDAIETTREKMKEDKAIFELIKDAVNDRITIYTEKRTGKWVNDEKKYYEFIIE